jgi:hypothetical protein
MPKQEESLQNLWRMAMVDEKNEELMDSMVLQVSAKFIMHSDNTLRKSALVYFLGALGYDEKTGRWREPNTHIPILASMTNMSYWNCWNSHCYSKIATGSTRLCWRSVRLLLLASFGAMEVYFCLRFAEAKFEFLMLFWF